MHEKRRIAMAVRYNKLWKILIDRKMKKKDLQEKAHLTHYQMTKLGRDENITTEIIGSICKALECSPDDIMEFYDE
jgi:putative transcriptional regulator